MTAYYTFQIMTTHMNGGTHYNQQSKKLQKLNQVQNKTTKQLKAFTSQAI